MINKQIHIFKNPFRNGRVFCFVLFVLTLLACNTAWSQASMKFADAKKSFGFVKKGELVTIEFEFENTGTAPLLITGANAECSCTSIEFPKQPLAPLQKGKIVVSFDTKSVYDRQDRTVEITSNAPNSPQKIRFKGVVLKP